MKKQDTRPQPIHTILRGDIFLADLSPAFGSEQHGKRPVLVLQNDTGNHYSSTVIVAALSRKPRHKLPIHVSVEHRSLSPHSVVMLEQIRTIDRGRLICYCCHLSPSDMRKVDRALSISVALDEEETTEEASEENPHD